MHPSTHTFGELLALDSLTLEEPIERDSLTLGEFLASHLSESDLCEKYAHTPYGLAFSAVREICPSIRPIFDISEPGELSRCMRGWLKSTRRDLHSATHIRAGYGKETARARSLEMANRQLRIAGALETLEENFVTAE